MGMRKGQRRSKPPTVRIPADWEPHACCWMAWAVHWEWGKAVNEVKRELSEVIQTIAQYEPVRLLAPQGPAFREARREFLSCSNVTVIVAPVDDIWMRDIAPTFAVETRDRHQRVIALDWGFNAWGRAQERPERPGDHLAQTSADLFGARRISAGFIAEGGAMVTDGTGTVITTRSCLLSNNRNPSCYRSDAQRLIETALSNLGMRQLIWLEGDASEPITNGHVDGYVLLAPMAKILFDTGGEGKKAGWRARDFKALQGAHSCAAVKFEVVQVKPPRRRYLKTRSRYFAPCYLNAHVANGAVIAPKFGDEECDYEARQTLANAFPDRKVVMLSIDTISRGGGGIHCLTQPMPLRGA